MSEETLQATEEVVETHATDEAGKAFGTLVADKVRSHHTALENYIHNSGSGDNRAVIEYAKDRITQSAGDVLKLLDGNDEHPGYVVTSKDETPATIEGGFYDAFYADLTGEESQ